jgi:DUF4097 and DUF4098 domain-containing protein YvlB
MIEMSDNGTGFGGFLIGVGGGWYLFRHIDFSAEILSYLLILIGLGIVINALLGGRKSPLKGFFGGLTGGLILALFITNGFSIFTDFATGINIGDMGDYRAQETQPIAGDITSDKLNIKVVNTNGPIEVRTWSNNEYRIDLTLKARGDNDREAQANLEKLTVDFTESTEESGGMTLQDLNLVLRAPEGKWHLYSVEIIITLPVDKVHTLDLKTTNGQLDLSGLEAETIILSSTNGMISFDDLVSETFVADTTNGKISGMVDASNANVDTTNGEIDLNLPCTKSGEYTLDTTNGKIDLQVPKTGDIGYDLDLDTSISGIDVELPDLDYTTNDDKRVIAKTSGFNSKAIQITIQADTTNGNIEIN